MAKTGPKRRPLADRLWKLVDQSRGPHACWLWRGATNRRYGIIAPGGNTAVTGPRYVHRVVYALTYEIAVDAIPRKLEVRHLCHTPLCCNPAHLALGTSKDNKRDSIRIGAMWWQKPYVPHFQGRDGRVLTVAQAREIKQRKAAGESTKSLAAMFGVDRHTIAHIHNGKTWEWLNRQ